MTQNAYQKEEESFCKTVSKVHISKIPQGANIITSDVLYNVKLVDDGSKMRKVRIAPHGNKDRMRSELKKDSANCSPAGRRIALSMSAIMKWSVVIFDFSATFLQSEEAKRDFYVVPPLESSHLGTCWLLLTAVYGLVNASATWQE